jgi:hypothetical protein
MLGACHNHRPGRAAAFVKTSTQASSRRGSKLVPYAAMRRRLETDKNLAAPAICPPSGRTLPRPSRPELVQYQEVD